ncbi:inositol monophosphatase family protein [Croceicoccus sp. F390]|uniref:Inositol monophosphatase family protein n=1 Tax=Croceicoccus esteveae TaxID=3075597 RepID=A0ABU2ZG13_9SPHN|nr:inositol monophosphatase family protein [Croceicoccus sp. F390]MDT0575340.1 inositol monophosphatase family protein [Croceicoccus sp. F390]
MIDVAALPVVDLLVRVAQEAILPHYRTLGALDVSAKAPGELVTIADRKSEAMLTRALTVMLPQADVVGEEAAHDDPAVLKRLGDTLCWIVDPLDGTHNFAAGRPPFAIIIALAQRGETLAGWIHDPLTGRTCHAVRGEGAYINGIRVHARSTGIEPPVAAVSMLYADIAERAQLTRDVAPFYMMVDIPRCAGEQYPRLATGVNDVSLFNRTLPWDHAAGVLWLNEAGGKAARPDGTTYRVDDNRTGLIAAASPSLWDGLARRLAKD